MWYMYLLIGLYLYMPFFSAWVEKATRKEMRAFLAIWFVSLFLPYMSAYIAPYFGVGYLFGESTWNAYGLFYYFAVGPFFLLIGPSSLPIPLQVPVMAVCIFAVAWAFTALVYKLLGKKAAYIMG